MLRCSNRARGRTYLDGFCERAVDDTDVVEIDRKTFDDAAARSLARAALAKAGNARAFSEAEHRHSNVSVTRPQMT